MKAFPATTETRPATAAEAKSVPRGFYLPALDGLRALAIVLVLLHHSAGGNYLARGGFVGVDVFFVLSGFLITALLVREHESTGRINLPYFYARRALRLFPALFTLLTAYVIYINYSDLGWEIQWLKYKAVLATLFYYNNWRLAFGGLDTLNYGLAPTWSLSIEEQFYLLWPLALIGLLKLRSHSARIGLVVCGIVAVTLWRATLWQGEAFAHRQFFGFDTRSDGLLWGCLLGLLAAGGRLPKTFWQRRALTVAAIISAGFLLAVNFLVEWNGKFVYLGGFTLICAASSCLLLEAFLSPSKLFAFALENKLSVWLGRISYGIYIYHLPVYIWVSSFKRHWVVITGVQITLALTAAALSYYLIEKPCLRLKRRFDPQ